MRAARRIVWWLTWPLRLAVAVMTAVALAPFMASDREGWSILRGVLRDVLLRPRRR